MSVRWYRSQVKYHHCDPLLTEASLRTWLPQRVISIGLPIRIILVQLLQKKAAAAEEILQTYPSPSSTVRYHYRILDGRTKPSSDVHVTHSILIGKLSVCVIKFLYFNDLFVVKIDFIASQNMRLAVEQSRRWMTIFNFAK